MSLIRTPLLVIGLVTVLGGGIALAQAPKRAPAEPTTIEKIENWTAKQKASIRRTWAKDKAKWTACRAKAKSEHWSRKEYWTSQYKCMTAS